MRILPVLLLTACASGVEPIVDADRPEHFFDVPFPSDELLEGDGTADLALFPRTSGEGLLTAVVDGWTERNDMGAQGFANNGAFYFRFREALELPSSTDGLVDDPVLLIDMETGALHPLEMRFTRDPLDDPFLAENLLAAAPAMGAPPRSGATLAAVVMKSAGVRRVDLPDGVEDALELAGVRGKAAVATVYTVGDATGQLQQLFEASDVWLGESPDWSSVSWQPVTHLDVRQGETSSGETATVFTATFEDGSTEESFLSGLEANGVHSHDFSTWPVAVYQASLPVPYFQDLADRPFMSPGVGHLSDTDVYTGWIDFEAGQLVSEPVQDLARVVLQVPLDGNGDPVAIRGVVIYDHGTGGHAYNAVQRRNALDRGEEIAQEFATAGFAVLSHDAPLYGTRFPLVDEGFTDGSLGFYNIVNLPAFRDNQRQTGVEGHVLRRYAEEGLPAAFPTLPWSDELVFLKAGHSLGSVTSHLSAAPEPDAYHSLLGSGSGGVFTHFILSTGLLNSDDPDSLTNLLLPLLGFSADDNPDVGEVLAASMGIEEEEARTRIDRLHPALVMFQWGMDPSDPMAVAPSEDLPVTLLTGIGDWQVPNNTSYALAEALPQGVAVDCTPLGDYDPHYCLHREDEGIAILADWLAEVP